ncbi:RNA 2',3'-cyclic phosphodiesterase [Alicyclobacillus acidiphilus]|uniref:RNA 2',3'-cyclic phosphodiesterase n=1 Tax=Alicyclobacillus acidiphilus TaxID=182455 RepID=UPI00082CF5D2|nr:RNA 2',3'-cyclic phosphodiesterase [Alicyclobacillus acidiphilus]
MTRRLFFGLDLPQAWKARLKAEQHALRDRKVEAAAWSNPDLLHITVVFLGMIEDDQYDAIVEAGRAAVVGLQPISIRSGSYGEFSRNKVFWLGLDKQRSEWQKLHELHRRVSDEVLARVPLDLDAKHYRPHITLARKMKMTVDVSRLAAPEPQLDTVITALSLFESTRLHGELTYPVLESFPLEGPSGPCAVCAPDSE